MTHKPTEEQDRDRTKLCWHYSSNSMQAGKNYKTFLAMLEMAKDSPLIIDFRYSGQEELEAKIAKQAELLKVAVEALELAADSGSIVSKYSAEALAKIKEGLGEV